MLRLERTYDRDLIRRIITHPRLYPHIASDLHPPVERFEPNKDPNVYFMLATDGDETLGLFITHSIFTHFTWELHHAILPHHWRRTHEIGEAFENWLWTNTPCNTAVGFTPANNKLALRYADKRGMIRSGTIPGAYPKNGKLFDLVVFTKSRPIV